MGNINSQAERIVGKVSKDKKIIWTPKELGAYCPICGARDEAILEISDYNDFLFCKNCNIDFPICLAKRFRGEMELSDRESIEECTKLFLDCIDKAKKGLYEYSRVETKKEIKHYDDDNFF